MARSGHVLMLILPSIAMTVVVPAFALYFMMHGLELIAGTLIIVFALIGSTALGVVGIGVSTETEKHSHAEEQESLKMLRTSQRALLEEMDQMVSVLVQVRDTLSPDKGER